jgi:hypothetical protein
MQKSKVDSYIELAKSHDSYGTGSTYAQLAIVEAIREATRAMTELVELLRSKP